MALLLLFVAIQFWSGADVPQLRGRQAAILIRLSPPGTTQDADMADDRGRDAYRLTDASHGVRFDIDGDGTPEQIAWTARGSGLAFLAIDRNGNGVIDSGAELFGNHTLPGVNNGFKALLQMTTVGERGGLDAGDPLWSKLLLWADDNHDGVSQDTELQSASMVLTQIGLGYSIRLKADPAGQAILDSTGRQILDIKTDSFGNVFKYQGWAEYRSERFGRNPRDRQRPIYEVILATERPDRKQ
jgi:hypothetical protein